MVAGTVIVIGSFLVRTRGRPAAHRGRPGGSGKGTAQGAGGNPNAVTRQGSPKEETRLMPVLVTVSTQIP